MIRTKTVQELGSLHLPFLALTTVLPTTFHPATKSPTATSSSPKIVLVEENLPGTIPAVITQVGTTSIPLARAIHSHRSSLSHPPSRTVEPVTVDPVDTDKSLMPQSSTVQMAQIISLDVDCAKESMVVKIKFDRTFNGLIYSKVFKMLECNAKLIRF